MIYLDNSSTTHFKPHCVKKATLMGLKKYSVNSSRGGYNLAVDGGMQILKVRELLANHFNANPENVVFTSSCTSAINLALRGSVKKGGHIITTALEHNSTLRTLEDLKIKGLITYTIVEPKNGSIDPKDIERAIKPNTYLITCIHISNVTGNENNIEAVGRIAKAHNLKYMVDIAQSAGHKRIDIKKLGINMISIAGHKGFYAPQGIGVLIFNDIEIKPIKTGGTGTFSESIVQPTQSPEGLESGTLSMPCILGLGAGVKYVENRFDRLNSHIAYLGKMLYGEIKKLPNYVVYSTFPENGVIAFNHRKKTSSDMGEILNSHGICVRTGLQCAPLVHRYYGTLKQGMVRASIGAFNTTHDIKRLVKVLKAN